MSAFSPWVAFSLFFLLTSGVATLFSQQPVPGSVATSDGYRAPLINPALLGVGNASGAAYDFNYGSGSGVTRFDGMADSFGLYFNGRWLSYVYEDRALSGSIHTLSLALPPARNFYMGGSYSWIPDGFSSGEPLLGVAYRPLDQLALGGTVRWPQSGAAVYRVGAGVRPLTVIPYFSDRVTLSADTRYAGSFIAPTLTLETELVDGVTFDVGYDMDSNRMLANLAISFAFVRAGSIGTFDSGGAVSTGTGYLHLSSRLFRSLWRSAGNTYVNYAPPTHVVERRSSPDFWPFTVLDSSVSVLELTNQIRRLAEDETVGGIVLKNRNFNTSLANMFELRTAFQDFRDAGKKIVFYYESTNTLNYALAASVGDRIYMSPGGYLNLVGLDSTQPYLRDFLDMIGIRVYNLTSGEYKSAGNIFSENHMTDSEREALSYLYSGLFDELTALIEEGRGNALKQPARELINDGPYLIATRAKDTGLIDGLIYEEELEDKLAQLTAGARIGDPLFAEHVRYRWSTPPRSRVALIIASGPIHAGEGQPGASIGSDTVARAIREARTNPFISGILLRVASGGGSSLASDVIAHEIQLCRSGKDAKPVVVSMGGVAASGGYYISSPAQRIIAQPATITGSIGVLAMIPNFAGLSEKLHINWDTVKEGSHADFAAPYKPLSGAEQQHIQASIESSYKQFLSVVARNRDMSSEAVDRVARGRVWSGRQAADRDLVDQLGGYKTAMETLQELIDPSRELELKEYTGTRGAVPFNLSPRMAEAQLLEELPAPVRTLLETARTMNSYGDERLLFIMPYEFPYTE